MKTKELKIKCPCCGQERDLLAKTLVGTREVSICEECFNEKVEKAKEKLKEWDARRLEDKAIRQVQLGTLIYSSMGKQPPYYLGDLLAEVAESYVEGCFRSCIFLCAEIAEQTIKHELIRNSEDPEETQWRLEIEKATFGKLIEEARKLRELKKYADEVQWLNDVRNSIVVHPLYVGVYEPKDNLQTKIWKNRTMIRNIHKTLKFLKKQDKEIILNTEIRCEGKNKFIKLKDLLNEPTSDHVFVVWSLLDKEVLEILALEAYRRMKKIIEGIYPTT
ncbi:MAG: hypothetical protein QW835_03475 [Candidatus Hadarchaeum sp.]